MKSSLKFCVIASGEYDLYIAEPRACEWDIAAGHAILKHAGGLITDFEKATENFFMKFLYEYLQFSDNQNFIFFG